jgi:hypothetical protein
VPPWRAAGHLYLFYLYIIPLFCIYFEGCACLETPFTVAYKISVGNTEGKKPLGRPRCRWKDNIKIDLNENLVSVDYIHLAQNRHQWRVIVNKAMKLRLP